MLAKNVKWRKQPSSAPDDCGLPIDRKFIIETNNSHKPEWLVQTSYGYAVLPEKLFNLIPDNNLKRLTDLSPLKASIIKVSDTLRIEFTIPKGE